MIILNMIVKNEAHIIERCLDSVAPIIDGVAIVDTGSTDNTMEVIREWAEHVSVPVYRCVEPWVNFAHNRNVALQFARQKFPDPDTNALFIDADETLQLVEDGRAVPEADLYLFPVSNGDLHYLRNAMVRLHEPFYWKGVVHEYLTNDKPHVREEFPGVRINVTYDGARSQNATKFAEDAAALLVEHARYPLDGRTVFYLAQSLRDMGDAELARVFYLRRAAMRNEWEEERWYAQYRAALLAPPELRTVELIAAHNARPARAEPLVALARNAGHAEAMLYLAAAAKLPRPPGDLLFVDTSCYRGGWQLLDEVLHHAFYVGQQEFALQLIADNVAAPAHAAERIESNRKWYG